jgi:hypothetical protein
MISTTASSEGCRRFRVRKVHRALSVTAHHAVQHLATSSPDGMRYPRRRHFVEGDVVVGIFAVPRHPAVMHAIPARIIRGVHEPGHELDVGDRPIRRTPKR